jgi:uncharacterized protein (DUF433 family)/DNA-binding transcriptional MerR regulator
MAAGPSRKGEVSEVVNVISAFTEEDVERLTGVTKRQLRYWDSDGFFVPSLGYEDRSRPYSRLYTFRDIVCLKVLNALRNEIKVTLPHLREVKDKLLHLGEDLWAKTTLYVLNKQVTFTNPQTGKLEEVVSGQGVLQIPLEVVAGSVHEAIKVLRQRDASSIGKVARKRGIAYNQPVIAGTRIPVRSVKAFFAAGYTVEQIRKEYPTLTEADVLAAIQYDTAA